MQARCASCRRFLAAHRVLLRRLLIGAGAALALAALGSGGGSRASAGDCKVFYS